VALPICAPNENLSPFFDPSSPRPDGSGAFIRDPFAGNLLPRNRWDSVGTKVLDFYPKANATPTHAITHANNFFGSGNSSTNNKRLDIRIDWARSEKHTMYGRVTKAWQTRQTPRFFGTGGDGGNEGDQ